MLDTVLAKQLSVFSEILTKSYDSTKIIPFSLLDKQKKRTISLLIEDEIKSMQNFHKSYSISMLTLNKAEEEKKVQDILDNLLRLSYPFISEGRGLTNPLAPVDSVRLALPSYPIPVDSVKVSIKLLPHLLPEGEKDSARLAIGQQRGESFTVRVWREKRMVLGRLKTGEGWSWGEIASAKIGEGNLVLTGYFLFLCKN